jgi:predicted ArsR family transcriptional regulator
VIESTKEQVLHLLQSRGGATVAALAGALDVGQASVRRHLDHLRAEGLVDVRIERHGVGRPAFVYEATEAAEERAPARYSKLLTRMFRGLQSLDTGEVSGHDGGEVLSSVLEEVAEQVAIEHQAEVTAATLEGRVQQTSQALQREGIVDGWSEANEGFRLVNSACPYRQAALASHGTCELDRRTIELLLEAPVRQVSRIADGQPSCEYIVQSLEATPKDQGSKDRSEHGKE